MNAPTFGSLFAGIGGIDLGLEWGGWSCSWQIEWDSWCQAVLAKHWPDVPRFGDITTVDWGTVEPVDLVVGGFPCQPVSIAGKRRAQADERWLWPEFARCIRDLRPRYVLVENTPGLLSANRGLAFGEVIGDLAALGYDAEWGSLQAAQVGAPHRRERIFVVAHAERARLQGSTGSRIANARRTPVESSSDVSNPIGQGLEGDDVRESRRQHADPAGPDWWTIEPDVGRVAHGLPRRLAGWRNASLKGLGNAVVPQVAYVLGQHIRRLMDAE